MHTLRNPIDALVHFLNHHAVWTHQSAWEYIQTRSEEDFEAALELTMKVGRVFPGADLTIIAIGEDRSMPLRGSCIQFEENGARCTTPRLHMIAYILKRFF